MPRLISLILAMTVWMACEEYPILVGAFDGLGSTLLMILPWLFALRWSQPREKLPFEAGMWGFLLLPVLVYAAWLGPFGGLHLWADWELPAMLGSWVGIAPFLLLQLGFCYGEAGLLRLQGRSRWIYIARQFAFLFFGILPLAIVAQGVEWGTSGVPESAEAWTAADRLWVGAVQLGMPLTVLPFVIWAVPFVLGAHPERGRWQAVADGLWRGRGRAPRVWYWATQGLIANALAVGFGPWRRVLVSDRLVAKLGEDEMHAVLAHELAHLERKHVATLLLGVAGAVLLGTSLVHLVWPGTDENGIFPSLLGLLPAVVVLPATRIFEMQADLDASARREGLAEALMVALLRLGRGAPRFGIRHFSLQRRVAELERCRLQPEQVDSWQRLAGAWKFGLRALFCAGVASGCLTLL